MKIRLLLPLLLIMGSAALAADSAYRVFPQIATGSEWSCDFFISNQGTQSASGVQLAFFNENGTNMQVTTNLGSNSSFTFALQPAETKVIRIASTGTTTSGYVLLTFPNDRSIRGTEILHLVSAGTMITDMGVSVQNPLQHFSVPVELNAANRINTGIAFVNPILGTFQNASQQVVVNLVNPNGTIRQTAVLQLAPGQHIAQYVDQEGLFPGMGDFAGTLSISAPEYIGVVAFRQDQSIFGTVAIDSGPMLGSFTQSNVIAEAESNNNESQAQQISQSAVISGSISADEDLDYFSFSGHAGDIVSFALDTSTSPSNLDSIMLLIKDGQVLAANDDSGLPGRRDSFLQVVLPEDGTYYLRVEDYFGYGDAGYTYRLHVRVPGSAPSGNVNFVLDTCPNPDDDGCIVIVYNNSGLLSHIRYFRNIGESGNATVTIAAGGYTETRQFSVNAGTKYRLTSQVPYNMAWGQTVSEPFTATFPGSPGATITVAPPATYSPGIPVGSWKHIVYTGAPVSTLEVSE